MHACFLVLEYLFTWNPAAVRTILWTEYKDGLDISFDASWLREWRKNDSSDARMRFPTMDKPLETQVRFWSLAPMSSILENIYYFKQVSESEVGNCSFRTGITAVFSAKQCVISKRNLLLILVPLEIPSGPKTSACPSGLVLRPGAHSCPTGCTWPQ